MLLSIFVSGLEFILLDHNSFKQRQHSLSTQEQVKITTSDPKQLTKDSCRSKLIIQLLVWKESSKRKVIGKLSGQES